MSLERLPLWRRCIVAAAIAGNRPEVIAEDIGMKLKTVWNVLSAARMAGIPVPSSRKSDHWQPIVDAALAGERPIDIAARLGAKGQAVEDVLRSARQNGIEIPPFRRGPKKRQQ